MYTMRILKSKVSKQFDRCSHLTLLLIVTLWIGSTPGECHIDPSLPQPGPRYDFVETSQRDTDIRALQARLSNCQRIFLKVKCYLLALSQFHGISQSRRGDLSHPSRPKPLTHKMLLAP